MSRHQAVSPGHCGGAACLQAHVRALASTWVDPVMMTDPKQHARIRGRNWHVLRRAAAALSASRDALYVTVSPHQNKPVVPLPAQDRAAFEAHLEQIVDQAFDRLENGETDSVAPVPLGVPSASEDAICGACQGHCCVHGRKSHGFLTKWIIARLLQDHPGLTRLQARDTYLDRLPKASVQGNCVFQSDTGCTLDRARRADICNRFKCGTLFAASKHIDQMPDAKMVVLAAGPDHRVGKVVTYAADQGAQVLRSPRRSTP